MGRSDPQRRFNDQHADSTIIAEQHCEWARLEGQSPADVLRSVGLRGQAFAAWPWHMVVEQLAAMHRMHCRPKTAPQAHCRRVADRREDVAT